MGARLPQYNLLSQRGHRTCTMFFTNTTSITAVSGGISPTDSTWTLWGRGPVLLGVGSQQEEPRTHLPGKQGHPRLPGWCRGPPTGASELQRGQGPLRAVNTHTHFHPPNCGWRAQKANSAHRVQRRDKHSSAYRCNVGLRNRAVRHGSVDAAYPVHGPGRAPKGQILGLLRNDRLPLCWCRVAGATR